MAGTIGESLTRMEVDIPPLATHIQPTFAFVLFLFLPARVCKYYNVKKSWNSCAIVLGIIFFLVWKNICKWVGICFDVTPNPEMLNKTHYHVELP